MTQVIPQRGVDGEVEFDVGGVVDKFVDARIDIYIGDVVESGDGKEVEL